MNPLDDPLAWLAAHPAADPVRGCVLAGLARRAAAQPAGALRQRLVAQLLLRAQAPLAPPAAPPAMRAPSPLAVLVAQLQTGAGPELRQVQAHRRTWGELRLARRLAEVRAPVPDHLGPLNSQVLVRRALQQLQAVSPDYLQHLLAQLDGLTALLPLQAAEAPADKPARKAASARKR